MSSTLLPPEAELTLVDQMDLGHHVVWHLPARDDSVSVARHAIRPFLSRWEVSGDPADSAELVVSELVTNAVVHGAPPVLLHIARYRGELWIAVHDAGWPATTPEPVEAPLTLEHRRGLQVVAAVADAFDISSARCGTFATACLRTAQSGTGVTRAD